MQGTETKVTETADETLVSI